MMYASRILVLGLAVLGLAAGTRAAPPGWQHYTDPKLGYSIAAPPGWHADLHHANAAFGPDHPIEGVAFHVPASLTRGTNLSTGSYVAVESVPGADCTPARFLNPPQGTHKLRADGRLYTAATSKDAGAGNRYESLVFVLGGTSPCLSVGYFIHSTALENYDPGTIRRFNRAQLLALFDKIRATLTLGK